MVLMPSVTSLLLLVLFQQAPTEGNARAHGKPQPINQTAPATAEFLKRVQDYTSLQRRVVEKIGKLDPTKSPAEIAAREKALGEAMRSARAGAKPGDLFAPEAARLFKAIIRNEFKLRGPATIRNREDTQEELPNFTPMVNQLYPTTYPLATFPPGVLRQLPALPKPLEYRFVQSNLILRDSEANLIVDVLPDAAPAALKK
jgi:hypothetical protein